MQQDTPSKLSPVSVTLHWLVGLSMLGMLGVGLYMHEFKVFWLYPWHKSFGVLLVVVILARVLWRWKNGWPSVVGSPAMLERILARTVHWLLIIGTVLMPVTGFMMSALGGHGVDVFGLTLVARNPDPQDPSKVMAHHAELATLGKDLHALGGKLILAALVLHIAGAAKHHLLNKDGTLRRMLGERL